MAVLISEVTVLFGRSIAIVFSDVLENLLWIEYSNHEDDLIMLALIQSEASGLQRLPFDLK